MKLFFRTVLYIALSLASLALLALGVIWLTLNMLLDNEPTITQFEQLELTDVQRIKTLALQASTNYSPDNTQTMELTDRDINLGISYFGPKQLKIPDATFLKAELNNVTGVLIATAPTTLLHKQVEELKLIKDGLQKTLWNIIKNHTKDKWINARWTLQIDDKKDKLQWIQPGKIRIGSLGLTQGISENIAKTAYAEFLKQEQSRLALSTWDNITGLKIKEGQLIINYKLPDSNQALASYQSLVLSSDEQSDIDHYTRYLKKLPNSGPLYKIFAPMFTEAIARSNKSLNPIAENRAVLLALSKAYGGDQLLQMLGNADINGFRTPTPYSLYKRKDLAQHYILSAGLTLVADENVASLIGIDKEIADLTGGRSISAWDLTADKAGARLAQNATSSAKLARETQLTLSRARRDSDLLPDIGAEFEFSDDRFSMEELTDLEILIELYLEQHPLLRAKR